VRPRGDTISDRDREVLAAFGILIVSFSAGKDSVSCLRWALETGKPVRVIMANTGNEPPDSFEYVRYIERKLRVNIEIYQRQGHTFNEIVKRRGMWPIPGRCLVSKTTKCDDFRYYLKCTETPLDALIVLGQRRSESRRRAALPDFEPIIRSGRACYRPILDWSYDDVMVFLSDQGIMAHPAYANGRKRVGCVWCVNSAHDDLVRDEELYPERCAELRSLRKSIGLSSIPIGVSQPMLFEQMPICQYSAVHCE
jgi:3'-phosphoadenosine 5'-phosphosulfate sulfotransferase (PAPS reductase)/FAD synthetase